MKKFLSLVLALVMTMSLVTISAGAKDFTDADAINYDEAIAVMSAVKVIDGYPDGSFKPATQLNRGQAAKIICNLVLGPTTASELPTSVAPFKDVTTDNVFAGYIAYCAKEGIVGGYADGTFKPTAPLTGYAFMKMLLGALGYDAEIEGYNDPKTWSIAVAKQALGIGLTAGLKEDFNGVKYVTREEACLYAFNTLKATMVDYDTKTSVNVGDATVTIAGSTAKPVGWDNRNTQTGIKYDGNIDADGFVQFAEQYFTKLVRKDDADKFMRPANTWVYDKKDIGTYVDYTKLVETYKKGVTGKDVYDLLKAATIRDDKLEYYVDGKATTLSKNDLVRSNNDDIGETGTGVLTEIYLDKDKELITIVSINTYLAKASADYSEKKEYAPLKVFETNATGKNYNVDVESVSAVKDVEKDGFYLVEISKKDVTTGEVVSIAKAEVLSDATVTKFSTSKGKATKLTTGGEEYKANEKAFFNDDVLEAYDKTLLTNISYNVYLDPYGNFIGVDIFEGTKNYVFITGFDRSPSNLSVKNVDAAGIFLDGTMKTIRVNVTDTDKKIAAASGANAGYFQQWSTLNGGKGTYHLNQWYTYTVDNDGVYTLKPCTRMTASTYTTDPTVIKTNNLFVNDSTYGNRVYGEDDTIFVTADLGTVDTSSGAKAITKATGTYTGVQNVELELSMDAEAKAEGQVYTVYDSDSYIIAAVVVGDAKGSTANYAYVLSEAKSEEKIDDTYYWTFEAIVGGEVKTLTAKSKYTTVFDTIKAERTAGVGTAHDGLVELRYTGDYVTDIKDITDIYKLKNVPINGEDFYDISDANVINLKGRTLYVTSTQTDNGLALAKDAKAVVIQKENGKSDVKTEFTDVATAIARLADKTPSTTDVLDYDGRIIAALDTKGVAQWIVFISKTELKTGNQANTGSTSTTTFDAANASVANVQYNSSAYTATFKVEKADFVPSDATLTVTYDVLVNGVVVHSDSTTMSAAASTKTIRDLYATFSGEVLTVEVTNVTTDKVKVEYYNADDATKPVAIDASKLCGASVSAKAPTSVAVAGETIYFGYKTTDASNALTLNFKSASLAADGTVKEGILRATGITPTTANKIDFWNIPASEGLGAVKVYITGIKDLVETYSIDTSDVTTKTLGELYAGTPAAYASNKLDSVTFNRTSSIEAGGAVALNSAAIHTAVGAASEKGLAVTLSTGHVLYFANSASTSAKVVGSNITVNSDVTVTVTKVEEVAAPTIVGVTYTDADANGAWSTGDKIVVTYSDDVDDSANRNVAAPTLTFSTSGATATGAWSRDGKVATYTIGATAPEAASTLKITAITSEVTGVKNIGTYTITFGATVPGTAQPVFA